MDTTETLRKLIADLIQETREINQGLYRVSTRRVLVIFLIGLLLGWVLGQ